MDWLRLNAWFWIAWSAYWFVAAWFVNRTKSSEGLLVRLQHLGPLALGFFLIFHFGHPLLFGRMDDGRWIPPLATAATAGGLLFTVWSRIHLGRYWSGIVALKEDHRLVRTGPYRFVRHPLYTGFLFAALGSALTAETGDALAGLLILLAAYLVKMRREEAILTREFGEEYLRFKKEVPALVPFVY
jgi:protein-S-isoprenylcysteine O-methyltransferase Ste14